MAVRSSVMAPSLLLIVLPVVIAAVVLMVATATDKGQKAFGRQGVAWFITSLMIVAAIGIGYGKAHASNVAEPAPDYQQGASPAPESVPPVGSTSSVWNFYVLDNAGVLADGTVTALSARNQRLYKDHGVVIGVVTCSYGRNDLDSYAIKQAENMGLSGNDMIVVLDIRGDNYWLAIGDDLAEDCSDYAWRYMEDAFAAGDYDSAVLSLTQALEDWYVDYFNYFS